ncbi:Methyltransferase domain-containing protein [Rhizobium sp. RU35A]|uniref:Class I SAM-dependent methyltransferase n=1 Tax=Rhizobium straminoryzae TaxID=1387186 RepID=A0A549T7C5_9HYPH|nr:MULTISPECIES: class I SAM-dependent methyltransferase [Rhizobium]TRL37773.1 class I SAM-dependent methyltransferase [Rhizobium straminoryzae]SIQ93844.1 Methyltransferase domain-containing protein [Rhizobium sp. RU35A]
MSGFDAKWLTLREPADQAARSPVLLDKAAAFFAARAAAEGPVAVLDVGCGTGSTYRALNPHLPARSLWRLLDHDPALLEEAARQIGTENIDFFTRDLGIVEALPDDGVSLVTASAFFDLASADFIDRFVARLAERRIALYAALNYDGKVTWARPHPLDQRVLADFNRHQLTDKGLGPALGPEAVPHLSAALLAHGYRVETAETPWRIGTAEADLHIAFLRGMVDPVLEVGTLPAEVIGEWLAFRLAYVRGERGGCAVGHLDLLALPPG